MHYPHLSGDQVFILRSDLSAVVVVLAPVGLIHARQGSKSRCEFFSGSQASQAFWKDATHLISRDATKGFSINQMESRLRSSHVVHAYLGPDKVTGMPRRNAPASQTRECRASILMPFRYLCILPIEPFQSCRLCLLSSFLGGTRVSRRGSSRHTTIVPGCLQQSDRLCRLRWVRHGHTRDSSTVKVWCWTSIPGFPEAPRLLMFPAELSRVSNRDDRITVGCSLKRLPVDPLAFTELRGTSDGVFEETHRM